MWGWEHAKDIYFDAANITVIDNRGDAPKKATIDDFTPKSTVKYSTKNGAVNVIVFGTPATTTPGTPDGDGEDTEEPTA